MSGLHQHFAVDHEPSRTDRAVLDVLAHAHPLQTFTRRQIQDRVFGDGWGASFVAASLHRLRDTKPRPMVERVNDSNRYRLTPFGRACHDFEQVFGGGAA